MMKGVVGVGVSECIISEEASVLPRTRRSVTHSTSDKLFAMSRNKDA